MDCFAIKKYIADNNMEKIKKAEPEFPRLKDACKAFSSCVFEACIANRRKDIFYYFLDQGLEINKNVSERALQIGWEVSPKSIDEARKRELQEMETMLIEAISKKQKKLNEIQEELQKYIPAVKFDGIRKLEIDD